MEPEPVDAAEGGSVSGWTRGHDSTVYRFERRSLGEVLFRSEVEVFDDGEAEARLRRRVVNSHDEWETLGTKHCESLADALDYARDRWDLDADDLLDSPTVRVKRLVLSLLADYVGSDAVYGHDVPAETRDALAAAYEALDEPGLPLTFHDCPRDGAALDQLPDDPTLPEHVEPLECPQCGEVYLLDRDTGKLGVAD